MAFGLLRTVVNAWYSGVEASSASRLITRNAVSMSFLSLAYKDRIRQVDGVTRVSYGNWFGGSTSTQELLSQLCRGARSYLDLYPSSSFPRRNACLPPGPEGAVAGKTLAERFRWKAGDLITLQGTVFPAPGSLS